MKKEVQSIYRSCLCGVCGKYAETQHLECEKRNQEFIRNYNEKMEEMAKKYGINKAFGPSKTDSKMTLEDAETILFNRLNHKPLYEINEVLENENWWFIPYGWIGVLGFIVEKESKEVFCLGSVLV